jgi:exodeoxyribonuclease VII small subunit
MPKNEPKPVDDLKYEQALAELESIVAALESGEQSLEEALVRFERGQALIKRCARLLEEADLKVQTLLGEGLTAFEAEK